MSIKLGELLLSEGAITQKQLDEALKCHVFFGIKLGSSLIELGFIQEDVLNNLLSKKLGVPAVCQTELFNVPMDVIKRVRRSLAEQFRVTPVRLENNRLYVAMSDPTDLKAQEELAFITGYTIVPLIAPEKFILMSHEKYYGVSRDYRYVCVGVDLQKRKNQQLEEEAEGFITGEAVYTISADFADMVTRNDLLNIPIPENMDSSRPTTGSGPEQLTQKQALERYTIDKLSLDFTTVRNRDDIANIFIKYLGQEFTKSALMTVRGSCAVGWSAVNNGQPVHDFETVTLDLTSCTEFKEILVGKHYFLGPLSEAQCNLPIIGALELRSSDTILALPVVMDKRIVAIIVVSSDSTSLQQRLDELKKLMFKASVAFQILVLKDTLLQT